MTVTQPQGVRDGDFVVFTGWDMPHHDIAYYPKLSGSIDDLKKIALANPGALITAFTSSGWMKTWATQDYSKWVQTPNVDLYVRVNYPGWYFVQGKDSPGHNLDTTSLGTNVAKIMVDTILSFSEERTARVAGFTTSGWVKTKISSDLQGSSNDPLEGVYIRTQFPGYHFYQGADSPGNDIIQYSTDVDNVPPLFGASDYYSHSMGVNTTGWIKNLITVPPPDHPLQFQSPRRGIYVRTRWPGYVFLPMLDSPLHNITWFPTKQIWKLVDKANSDPQIVAFNTDGWYKSKLANAPIEIADNKYDLCGLYVKVPDLEESAAAEIEITRAMVDACLFVFKGTVYIWGRDVLVAVDVRLKYNEAAAAAVQDIWRRIDAGSLTHADAAREATTMRNMLMENARNKTPPLFALMARSIKPDGRTMIDILDDYADRRFGAPYESLTQSQAQLVAGDAIDAAGRPNRKWTSRMKMAGKLSKAFIAIGIAVSFYQVVTAEDWGVELGNQVASWSGAIIGGKIGAGVGMILGPAGAVVGGIVGGMIGAFGGQQMLKLARWFYGGGSGFSAADLLGPSLLVAARFGVQEQLRQSGKKFHVHQVLATHLSGDPEDTANIAEDMIATKSEMRVDVEVVATVVWVVSDGEDTPPLNPGNPADLIRLMKWAAKSLPN